MNGTGSTSVPPKPNESMAPSTTSATTMTASTSAKRPTLDGAASTPLKKVATVTKPSSGLQQQIQQQLQEQLQQQLAAAAARGQQAHITPAHIQAQAAAMVQAAAQAQAVVAAAKARAPNGKLQPMTAAQVQALSQIQAAAIVNSRKTSNAAATANSGGTAAATPSPAQVQAQIQMQAQALVHAHTQALIQAGVYKGDAGAAPRTTTTAATSSVSIPVSTTVTTATGVVGHTLPPQKLTPAQAKQVQDVKTAHVTERAACSTTEQQAALDPPFQAKLRALYDQFRRQGNAGTTTPIPTSATASAVNTLTRVPNPTVFSNPSGLIPPMGVNKMSIVDGLGGVGGMVGFDGTVSSEGIVGPDGLLMSNISMATSTTPAVFAQQMAAALQDFWSQAHRQIDALQDQTEHDFKNHNDLPLARIKRIMKSDEDVRMIAAEAPVLLAKACELFILDISIRAWNYSQWHKRRTLQKEDVKEAIQKTDIFDFLVDVIP